MSGSNETNNAWGICAYGFYYSWGKYQSLYQAKGAFCQYYTGPGCLQEIQGELDSGEGDIFIADIEKDFHHFVSYSCGPSKINGSTYEKPTDGD